jgi:phage-related protein
VAEAAERTMGFYQNQILPHLVNLRFEAHKLLHAVRRRNSASEASSNGYRRLGLRPSQFCEYTRNRVPTIGVVLYREEDGSCPFLEWFEELPTKVQDKCYIRLERLREMGHELRRPEADHLRDGIHELRVSLSGVHHRILYFFHGRAAAVVSHGLVKERAVPPKEIDRAIERKKRFEANPAEHTFEDA